MSLLDLRALEDAALAIVGEVARTTPNGQGLVGGEEGVLVLLTSAAATYDELDLEGRIADGLGYLSGAYRVGGEDRRLPLPLFFGLAGFGWLASVAELADEASLAAIDRTLGAALTADDPPGLMEGTSGLAVYALSRPAAMRDALLGPWLSALEASSAVDARGRRWISRGRDGKPGANLGLAHGVPGVMAMLARVVLSEGAHADRARRMLEQTTAYFLTERRGQGAWTFPPHERLEEPARLGWCYGDLSAAVALRWAGCALRDDSLLDLALDVATRSTARTPKDGVVRDAALCHGAAGIALIYQRLHAVTGAVALRDAADEWYGRALVFEDRGAPRDLLNGQVGLALALLTRVHDLATWDEVLATNIP